MKFSSTIIVFVLSVVNLFGCNGDSDEGGEKHFNVELPDGTFQRNLNINEMKETLIQHYEDVMNDPELARRLRVMVDEVLHQGIEEAQQLETLEEREEIVGRTVLRSANRAVRIYQEWFLEKTGKNPIEIFTPTEESN